MDCLGRWVNKNIHKLYLARHILVLGCLNGVKWAKTMAKWGVGKYKIINFEVNYALEVL